MVEWQRSARKRVAGLLDRNYIKSLPYLISWLFYINVWRYYYGKFNGKWLFIIHDNVETFNDFVWFIALRFVPVMGFDFVRKGPNVSRRMCAKLELFLAICLQVNPHLVSVKFKIRTWRSKSFKVVVSSRLQGDFFDSLWRKALLPALVGILNKHSVLVGRSEVKSKKPFFVFYQKFHTQGLVNSQLSSIQNSSFIYHITKNDWHNIFFRELRISSR